MTANDRKSYHSYLNKLVDHNAIIVIIILLIKTLLLLIILF